MKVYAYTITRADTPERGKLLNSTLTLGRETAAHGFHWHLHVNGWGGIAQDIATAALATGVLDSVALSQDNKGQHVPTNTAIDLALEEDYDYILRTDDDVEWLSKRWLAKLVEASQALEDRFILSPSVKGLRWQPPQSARIEVNGIPLKIVEGPLGGICRLTPVKLLREKPYISDVRLPMGGGDAMGVGNWAMQGEPLAFLAYCQHINIRHAKTTSQQETDDPTYFRDHDLYQYTPYIPNWSPTCE